MSLLTLITRRKKNNLNSKYHPVYDGVLDMKWVVLLLSEASAL